MHRNDRVLRVKREARQKPLLPRRGQRCSLHKRKKRKKEREERKKGRRRSGETTEEEKEEEAAAAAAGERKKKKEVEERRMGKERREAWTNKARRLCGSYLSRRSSTETRKTDSTARQWPSFMNARAKVRSLYTHRFSATGTEFLASLPDSPVATDLATFHSLEYIRFLCHRCS